MSHSSHSTIRDIQQDMYFGTEVLNRVSFLREDNEFITQSIFHPSTRFIFYQRQKPLIHNKNKLTILTNGSNQINLTELNHGKVGFSSDTGKLSIQTGLFDGIPQWKSILHTWNNDNRNQSVTIRSGNKPVFLFLGLLDESVGLDLYSLKFDDECSDEKYLDHQGRYQGIAYYAVDITPNQELSDSIISFVNNYINQASQTPEKSPLDNGIFFTHSRKHFLGFEHKEASLFSHGAMFFHWLNKNRFCPGCGEPTIPIHAGGKLYCTNTKIDINEDDPEGEGEKFACPVKSSHVANVSFPRTDMAIISTIASRDRSKILLSLSKRYAITKMYSCTAGFMEPSETVEIATKREIWEETGVNCSEIDIIMTQPWPFPSNLMIGCMGIVDFNGENESIHLGHDNELSDARWFDTDFVRKLIYPDELSEGEKGEFNPEGILLPMPESIAFQLIKLVVDEANKKHKL
ncbi:NPY1 [[Candida] subhashii]|uniref:NPY1 n=1 Tax=[Candida] subhashii TaxID=561895 RepID=A0A8J5Q2D6_9ASCO|nr:NPY1 [[Candida] subhashii]KAG7660839.1 NPY1 [[Candida] subhashii]